MLNSYIELNFDVLHAADDDRYANADKIRLVNLGPIALFSNYKLTTSSGKHLEEISHAHIVSLMYKLLTSSKDSDDLSIGFDRNRGTRKNELTNNKTIKGKYHIRIYLKDIFGFAEHQEHKTFKGFNDSKRLLDRSQYFNMKEGEKISAMLPRSWKKSFDNGIMIPSKMRFCNECNDKKTCNKCNNLINENK